MRGSVYGWPVALVGALLATAVWCCSAAPDRDFLLPRASPYFGLQTKSHDPLYVGLCWNEYLRERTNFLNVRENAAYQDDVGYKVLRADGLNFAHLSLNDTQYGDFNLQLQYVKPQASNTSAVLRVSGRSNSPGEEFTVAVFFYVGVDETGEANAGPAGNDTHIFGFNTDYPPGPGGFELRTLGRVHGLHTPAFYFANSSSSQWAARDTIMTHLHTEPRLVLQNQSLPGSNLAIVQRVLRTPFSWAVALEATSDPVPLSFDFDDAFSEFDNQFTARHWAVFRPPAPGGSVDDAYAEFGREVLSHLLYGLSYFFGTRYYINDTTGERIALHDCELLSFIPSKNGFPRPFFWDEGFHEMAVWKWDAGLFEAVVESWFKLQLDDGWIVREMIIGEEALSHAPEWAWAQRTSEMNPPVMFLAVEDYVRARGADAAPFLGRIYPHLVKTYGWYLGHTQPSKSDAYNHTFFWNGRYDDKSYDSGFDDFPRYDLRVHPPSAAERNVDLQSWMVALARAMRHFAQIVGDVPGQAAYGADFDVGLEQLLRFFWNPEEAFFTDVLLPDDLQPHVGVAGILPLCLGLLDADGANDSALVNVMLDTVNDRLLDSTAGILSLAPSDVSFNSLAAWIVGAAPDVQPSDHPEFTKGTYWRGGAWGNLNYLCFRRLRVLDATPSLYPAAGLLWQQVRDAYVRRVYEHYKTVLRNDRRVEGSIFEVYQPFTGNPICHWPFAGWTASAVLLMIAEGGNPVHPSPPSDRGASGSSSSGFGWSHPSFVLGLFCGVFVTVLLAAGLVVAERFGQRIRRLKRLRKTRAKLRLYQEIGDGPDEGAEHPVVSTMVSEDDDDDPTLVVEGDRQSERLGSHVGSAVGYGAVHAEDEALEAGLVEKSDMEDDVE